MCCLEPLSSCGEEAGTFSSIGSQQTCCILRVCYALTVHKVQAMSIGDGETFEKAVVHFAEGKMANIPWLMLTAFSRVKEVDDLAVGTESNSLTVNNITKIGATKAYKKKKNFGNSSRFSLSSQCREPSITLQHWIIKTQ